MMDTSGASSLTKKRTDRPLRGTGSRISSEHQAGGRHRHPAQDVTPPPHAPLRRDLTADSVILPRTGLHLRQQLPYDKWLSIGRHLAITASSSAWCLGDWLIYGENFFNGRYRDAIEQTSLDYKTLRNYAWVARRFQLSRRHEDLSFGHHAEVASLPEPEQDFWLRKAEAFGWSRNALRREVQASLRERQHREPVAGCAETDTTGQGATTTEQLQVEVTADQMDVIRQAASRAGLTIDAWAARILENAARSTLSRIGVGSDPEELVFPGTF
jgi:hypothetical protein